MAVFDTLDKMSSFPSNPKTTKTKTNKKKNNQNKTKNKTKNQNKNPTKTTTTLIPVFLVTHAYSIILNFPPHPNIPVLSR